MIFQAEISNLSLFHVGSPAVSLASYQVPANQGTSYTPVNQTCLFTLHLEI